MVGFLIAFLLIADIPEERFTTLREEMVFTQIMERAIRDQPTLNAMRTVKRHRFVPERLKAYAYEDGPLPIGHGQTISQPYIVAYMTEFLRLKPGSSVLEIGTGSGYQAAVLSCIAGEVYTVEIIAELGQQAQKRLKALGYQNVMVRVADGYNGWEEHAPYDAIIVTAAAEYIPPPLIKQLKDGGRMVIPVGSPFLVQTLMLVEKSGGVVKTKSLLPVRFVPLIRGK
jgi:protein-L-isoaspartate(D-aspartate) O-methyltransferase